MAAGRRCRSLYLSVAGPGHDRTNGLEIARGRWLKWHVSRTRASTGLSASSVDLQALANRFQQPLRSFFRKRVYDPQEADDLVQEVFVRLSQQGSKRSIENPEAYIFQMAANLLRDRARRSKSRMTALRELCHRSENRIEEISPERVLQGRQGLADVHRALAELPERTRVIFVLHRFEELRYSEIASRLGISVSGVEKQMMDAIRHLAVRVRGKTE